MNQKNTRLLLYIDDKTKSDFCQKGGIRRFHGSKRTDGIG